MTPEEQRRQDSFDTRVEAARIANERGYSYRLIDPINGQELPQPTLHQANGDEEIERVPVSFTKGLPHDYKTGLVANEADFDQLVKGIDSGEPLDFKRTPLGPDTSLVNPNPDFNDPNIWKSTRGKDTNRVRAWESESAGLALDLEGPDAQAVTMPPAPKLGSDELTAEMGEVYAQAVMRDVPFENFTAANPQYVDVIKSLNKLDYFKFKNRTYVDKDGAGEEVTVENAFRGVFRGDLIGPYISQFLLVGNTGINSQDLEQGVEEGLITYGAIQASQKVRNAKNIDYMKTWDEWFDVQNGADFRDQEEYENRPGRKFIATPRDLATYVHYDALYEAYLNACLIMLGAGAGFDPGIPFQLVDKNGRRDVRDHQQGFAIYGGPHILTLVTEVATRALKAVRYQKFNVHRRCRPEVLAARMDKLKALKGALDGKTFDKFSKMHHDLKDAGIFNLLTTYLGATNELLPMAFVEGSPMHPSYGAGHATVAGACATILKAWFDHTLYFNYEKASRRDCKLSFSHKPDNEAWRADAAGRRLERVKSPGLTIEGEVNKVAANVAIGRDWAGVHYFTDYTQSMIMGEEIAIGLLQEQSITYLPQEGLTMTVPKFDGSHVLIKNGEVIPV